MNGTQYGGMAICDTQVFHALTGCQRDPRGFGASQKLSSFKELISRSFFSFFF